MGEQVTKRIFRGHRRAVVVKRKKLSRHVPRKPKEDREATLSVVGEPALDSDGATLVITLSRNPTDTERSAIFTYIRCSCGCIRETHFRDNAVRVRQNERSGEPLWQRTAKEAVEAAINQI